jgi:hypothetical protein
MVDLLDIARQDDFRPLPGTGDDRLDFVGREVLGLVHDEIDPLQTASANVRQRSDFQLLVRDQVLDLVTSDRLIELLTHHRQIVVERLHVGA